MEIRMFILVQILILMNHASDLVDELAEAVGH